MGQSSTGAAHRPSALGESGLRFLRDQGQPQTAWLSAIAADQTISEPVRQRDLQVAREWKTEAKTPTE